MATLGERLRILRKERGLTQEAVARRTDIGLKAYSELERGITLDPHYSTLASLARALDVTVAELVGEEALAPLVKAPGEGQAKLEGWPLDLNASYWIENLTSQAELVEHTIARGGYDLKTIWYLEGAAREFWGTYSLTVKKLVREWCAPNQVEALTKAEARMKEARKAATRAYLERRDAEADRQKIDELEPRRRAREAEYARYANAGEAT